MSGWPVDGCVVLVVVCWQVEFLETGPMGMNIGFFGNTTLTGAFRPANAGSLA